MKIAIGCDHAGYEAKAQVMEYLRNKGFDIEDKGCYSTESVHYPVYGAAVAQAVASGAAERGVLVCGTGIGMTIVANKFFGIRAALCHDDFTARCSREHNDANILVIGGRVLAFERMKDIIDIWFSTDFAGGRHQIRLDMIKEIEERR
jgi:ribose 5-phosphate isomerase B